MISLVRCRNHVSLHVRVHVESVRARYCAGNVTRNRSGHVFLEFPLIRQSNSLYCHSFLGRDYLRLVDRYIHRKIGHCQSADHCRCLMHTYCGYHLLYHQSNAARYLKR